MGPVVLSAGVPAGQSERPGGGDGLWAAPGGMGRVLLGGRPKKE